METELKPDNRSAGERFYQQRIYPLFDFVTNAFDGVLGTVAAPINAAEDAVVDFAHRKDSELRASVGLPPLSREEFEDQLATLVSLAIPARAAAAAAPAAAAPAAAGYLKSLERKFLNGGKLTSGQKLVLSRSAYGRAKAGETLDPKLARLVATSHHTAGRGASAVGRGAAGALSAAGKFSVHAADLALDPLRLAPSLFSANPTQISGWAIPWARPSGVLGRVAAKAAAGSATVGAGVAISSALGDKKLSAPAPEDNEAHDLLTKLMSDATNDVTALRTFVHTVATQAMTLPDVESQRKYFDGYIRLYAGYDPASVPPAYVKLMEENERQYIIDNAASNSGAQPFNEMNEAARLLYRAK